MPNGGRAAKKTNGARKSGRKTLSLSFEPWKPYAKIALVAALALSAACQEMPRYFGSDSTLARAAGNELRLSDVQSVVPQGLTGRDSAAFLRVYVDRWVRKQLMLQEAELLFSSSEEDIDRMVEEYRQALLIRRLDRHYVDRNVDTVFTDSAITAYYEAHKADFRSDRTLVKGRILQFPRGGAAGAAAPS